MSVTCASVTVGISSGLQRLPTPTDVATDVGVSCLDKLSTDDARAGGRADEMRAERNFLSWGLVSLSVRDESPNRN